MDDTKIRSTLLEELDASRRRDPQRYTHVGRIDLRDFLLRNRIATDAYLAEAARLLESGLIQEPSIDQLSLTNGGIYITEAGLRALDENRHRRQQRLVEAVGGPPPPTAVDFIDLVWRTFSTKGRWPEPRVVERSLIARRPPRADVSQELRALPSWVGYARPGSGDGVRATLLGLVVCAGEVAGVAEDFWRAATRCRRSYEAASPDTEANLTSDELAAPLEQGGLNMNELQIRRTLEFLRSEQMLSGGWLRDSNGEYRWSYTISDRAHDLIDIDTVEDYLVLNAYAAMAMVEATVSNSTSPDPRKVFVIHGRDQEATDAVFDFLRCLDLRPLEWEDLIRLTGSGSPYTGEAVARAFTEAQAVVVVITPDDEVRLHPSLLASDDPEYESNFTGQARPNVLLEAGMALGAQPNRTIIVELGHVRPVSDLTGRNVLRLGKGSDPLNAFVERLTNAECAVNRANPSWMDATRFSSLNALTRRPHTAARAAGSPPNAAATRPPAGAPGVTARLVPRGNSHLLEVTNTGAVPLNKLSWQIQDDAPNWAIMSDVLPEYPVEHLAPNEHVRVPVSITMGGPVVVRLRVNAATPGGEECGGTFTLSIYG